MSSTTTHTTSEMTVASPTTTSAAERKLELTRSVPSFEHVIDHLYFYATSMSDLVASVLSHTHTFARKTKSKWAKFEDGFPNIKLDVDHLPGRHVVFFADLYSPADLFSQVSVLFALPRFFCRTLTVVLPFFPTGTMERIDKEGQVATAVTLARILSAIPLSLNGPTKLIIYDIHTLQNRFYFGDNVIPLLKSAMPDLIDLLEKNHADEDVCIAFPDEGASKRFAPSLPGYHHIICSKVRDGDRRIVVIKEGDCTNKHVFIVDDLVRTGGTLEECRKALKASGALRVSCFVTHAVFPNDKNGVPTWQKFVRANKPDTFDYFYVTDSCPTITSQLANQDPFRVVSLAPSIGGVIKSLTTHKD